MDIRNVIKVKDELREKLERYRGKLPGIILDELYERLKGKNISEEKLEEIVERIQKELSTTSNLMKKLEEIEKFINGLARERSAETIDTVEEDRTVESPKIVETPTVRLNRIPNDAERIMILLRWIEFMIERVGYDGLEDVLDYYVDVGWISEEVMLTILRYARGIKLYHENSDWRPVGFMSVRDHMTSLMFIEALRTGKFDRDAITLVERTIQRIKKGVEELYGV